LEPLAAFPNNEISLKIVLAIGVGLLVGLEREFASKDVGVRTFSLVSVFGLLTSLIHIDFLITGLVSTLVMTAFMNARSMLADKSLEITTSVAMLVTFCLGALVGNGHVFTPVASAIIMTLLLSWKTELSAFAHGLKLNEIRSAVIFGLLSFVIYPLLPNAYVDKYQLFNPRESFMTVIVLAGLSFTNYVLLKIYSTRGLYYSALLGGAVSSSSAAAEVSNAVKTPDGGVLPHALPILLMTTVSMFIRNLALLGGLEPRAIPIALAPLVGMSVAAGLMIWRAQARHEDGTQPAAPIQVDSPVSLRRVGKYALMFVSMQILGTLGVRYLGDAGVLSVSFFGGLVSSASATASVAKLASQGKISPSIAGFATVLTSVSSALVHLPIVSQVTHDKALVRKLAFHTLAAIFSGLVLMALVEWLFAYI
jgi:uncharacterized membrane protein (DUF4010 family)